MASAIDVTLGGWRREVGAGVSGSGAGGVSVSLGGSSGGVRDYEKLKNKPRLKLGEGEPVEVVGTVQLPGIPLIEPISNADICQKFKEVFK